MISKQTRKPGVSKKLITYGLFGFIVIAFLFFATFVGLSNPAQDRRANDEKEKIARDIKESPDNTEDAARQKIREIEVAEEQMRSRLAEDEKISSEKEAERVAKGLNLNLPRANGAIQPASEPGKLPPPPNGAPFSPDAADRFVATHQNASASNTPIGAYEGGGIMDGVAAAVAPPADAKSNENNDGVFSSGEKTPSGKDSGAGRKEVKVSNAPAVKLQTPSAVYTKKYMLAESSVIRTVFVTAVNSQNPGQVVARVTEDVYDSVTGYNLLIPKGTRLVGRYESSSSIGQDRMMFAFEKLLFNDGRVLRLPKMPAISRTGESGADAEHHSNLIKATLPSLITGIFGAFIDRLSAPQNEGSTLGSYTNSAPVTPGSSVARQVFPSIEKRLGERYAAARPYFTIKAGETFVVMVNADFAIPPESDAVLIKDDSK